MNQIESSTAATLRLVRQYDLFRDNLDIGNPYCRYVSLYVLFTRDSVPKTYFQLINL